MAENKGFSKPREVVSIFAIVFIIIVVSWSILLYYVTPEEILNFIGVDNGYIIVFISGLFGGTSLFFPFPYYLVVLTFGAAGLNPYLLGLFTALGVALGECTSYFAGYGVHTMLPQNTDSMIHKFRRWLERQHKLVISIILFLWGSLIPFPNDFILVPLGLIRYPFWRTIVPLALGSVIFNTVIALTGDYSWTLLFS